MSSKTVKELRATLAEHGLPTTGKKADLLKRVAGIHKKMKKAPAPCTIINKSSVALGRYLSLEQKTGRSASGKDPMTICGGLPRGQASPEEDNAGMIPPGNSYSFELPRNYTVRGWGDDEPDDQYELLGFALQLRAHRGVTFDGRSGVDDSNELRLSIERGGAYTIVDDVDNPVLSEEQFWVVEALVREALECTPTNESVVSVFADIVDTVAPGMSAEWLRESFTNSEYQVSRKSWTENYIPPVVVGDMASTRQILQSHSYAVEVYWRALDRFPGGNSDQETIRYTMGVEKIDEDNYVYVYNYSNWDGSQAMTGPYVPESVDVTEFRDTFIRLLSPLETNNSTFNIVDNKTVDREEFDTSWSSIEILVKATPLWNPSVFSELQESVQQRILTFLMVNNRMANTSKLTKGPLHYVLEAYLKTEDVEDQCVLRLHRTPVYGAQFGYGRNPTIPPVEPSPLQRAAMDGMNALVGMKRVLNWGAYNQWYQEGDGTQCRAGRDFSKASDTTTRRQDGYLNYIQPCVFRFM